MNVLKFLGLLACGLVGNVWAQSAAVTKSTAMVDREGESRKLAEDVQARLGQKLMQALQLGGPVASIGVCHLEAPAISEEMLQQTGVTVRRTALKVRNSSNIATESERQILTDFEKRLQTDASAVPEYFQQDADGSSVYMRAIVAQPQCLVCHGNVTAELQQVLHRMYPDDQATGYQAGDLRGAFVVEWPAVTP